MVLVSMCWYLDQQIKATEGKWKVLSVTSCCTQMEMSHFYVKYVCPLFTHWCCQGPRHSQTHAASCRAGVHCWREDPEGHWPRQAAVPRVGELMFKLILTPKEKAWCCVRAVWPSTLVLQTQDLQVVCYAFTAFGKAAIKQRKLHPDTFVQLAMQLAYYRLHKKYELIDLTLQTWWFESTIWMTIFLYPSKAGELLWDGNNSQVLPRQDGHYEALHPGGRALVCSHDGPHVWCERWYCWNSVLC